MPELSAIHIDTAIIPEMRATDLAKGALLLVDLAFSAPDAEERYQKWLEDRRKRRGGKKCLELL